ncbi:MAG: hypothetical protein ABSE45_02435 [Candidatus Acidiferrales bacterium]
MIVFSDGILGEMKKLGRSYWRLGWILLTNGAICLLLLSAPIRWRHNQLMLYSVMRTTPPAFSYWKELSADRWAVVVLLILLTGILAEVRRTVLAPIVNLGFYVVYFGLILFEQAKAAFQRSPQDVTLGFVLIVFVIPLLVIIAVDLALYIPALRRSSAHRAVAR